MDRYIRLYSLERDLYTEGSPVIIAAGVLLKDSRTEKLLVQLKLRSISQKRIKAVKVRIKAYDASKGQIKGIDSFSYLDLNVGEDEEFGQKIPIHMPDVTTRSFGVEILSVVFGDDKVFRPAVSTEATSAPQAIIDHLKVKNEARDSLVAEQEKSRIIKIMIICAAVSAGLVGLSLGIRSYVYVIKSYVKYPLALIIPAMCAIAAVSLKKYPKMLDIILPASIGLTVIKLIAIVIYGFNYPPRPELGELAYLITKYINGHDLLEEIVRYMKASSKLSRQVASYAVLSNVVAILPNFISIGAMAFCRKKLKNK